MQQKYDKLQTMDKRSQTFPIFRICFTSWNKQRYTEISISGIAGITLLSMRLYSYSKRRPVITLSSKCVVLVWTFLEYKYHKYFCVHHRHWWHIVDTVSLIWCCANLWHLKCCSTLPIIRFVGDQPEGVLNFTMCPYVHTSRIWFRSVTLWQIIWNV